MGIVINRATWGDETSATDITASLQKKAADGYLNTVANMSLLPSIDLSLGADSVELSDSEKADLATQAQTICGSVSDQKCIAYQTNQLQASLVQTKIAEKQSSANIITGRRLTLTYTDSATGAQKTVAVPDGQEVKFGTPPVISVPATSDVAWTIGSTATTVILSILYLFSIAVTYRLLVLKNHLLTAYILTFLAIIVPYSGLITTPIALAIFAFMGSNKVVPNE
jgi:hypothetical protein